MKETTLKNGQVIKTPYLDTTELMAYLGVNRTTINRWRRLTTHPIPYHQPSAKVVYFDIREVEAWLRSEKEAA